MVGVAEPVIAPSATDTAAEPAELTTATTLRPLATTAELASATMTRVRMLFIPRYLPGQPAHERLITLCNARCRHGNFNGHIKRGQRRTTTSPQLEASYRRAGQPSPRPARLRSHPHFPCRPRSAPARRRTGAGRRTSASTRAAAPRRPADPRALGSRRGMPGD